MSHSRRPRIRWLALALGLLLCPAANRPSDERISAVREGRKCVIFKGSQKYLTIDFAQNNIHGALMWPGTKVRPVSPDGKHIPLYTIITEAEDSAADLILLELNTHAVVRQSLYRNIPYFRIGSINWLAPTRIGVSYGASIQKYLIHDIATNTTKYLTGEGVVASDSQGANYASVFGKLHWITRHGQTRIYPEQLLVSEALRYNSYWVYPAPLTGFMTEVEYDKWQSDIGIRESGKGKGEPPIIRSCGVAIDRNHVLSTLAFLGNTPWVGFFEQIFPTGKFDQVLESNVVLLDAHRVQTNPPVADDILVKKRPMPSIVPTTHTEYIHLATTRLAKWNGATSSLELWEIQGTIAAPYRLRKIGEVPIDLSSMGIGAYRPVEGQWREAAESE